MNGQFIIAEKEHINVGDAVQVVKGPLTGLFGESVEIEGKHRVLITIDSIGAAFTVNVPRSFVKRINKKQIA